MAGLICAGGTCARAGAAASARAIEIPVAILTILSPEAMLQRRKKPVESGQNPWVSPLSSLYPDDGNIPQRKFLRRRFDQGAEGPRRGPQAARNVYRRHRRRIGPP